MLKPSKFDFHQRLAHKLGRMTDRPVRLLELGCGRAEIPAELLKKFPNVTYVGIEPDPTSCATAKKNLSAFEHSTVLNGLAYGGVENAALRDPFDIVFSLSVLEHVKDLPTFIKFSADKTKQGGEIVHLYDLGHSLYPSSFKERVQVWLCNSPLLPFIPENKIARYLSTEYVQGLLESNGCAVKDIAFRNLRGHSSVVRDLNDGANDQIMQRLVDHEQWLSGLVTDIKKKEYLLPSICFWTVKG